MRTKRHPNGNEYLHTPHGYWVRNYARSAPYLDINSLTRAADYDRLIRNQTENVAAPDALFAHTDLPTLRKVAIVSDGHGFERNLGLLKGLPADVRVLAIGRSLAKWDLAGRPITFYVVNNPYPECLAYLPTTHRYFPSCLASTRTNPEFVRRYRGNVCQYFPVPEERFAPPGPTPAFMIDDYRNPVCAALGLAYRMGATRILLMGCDESFEGERPGAEPVGDGLWQYPQQRVAHELVDGFAYWFRRQPGRRTLIGDHSSGQKYSEIQYIVEDGLTAFFNKEL